MQFRDAHVLGVSDVPAPGIEHTYGYIRGHDGLTHLVDARGFCACGMGREQHPRYLETAVVSCFQCIIRPWRIW